MATPTDKAPQSKLTPPKGDNNSGSMRSARCMNVSDVLGTCNNNMPTPNPPATGSPYYSLSEKGEGELDAKRRKTENMPTPNPFTTSTVYFYLSGKGDGEPDAKKRKTD